MASDPLPPNYDYKNPEENEPYLGPGWAVVMLILFALKEAFPAEKYTALWWVQVYVLTLIMFITAFVIYKRRKFFRRKRKQENKKEDKP